MAQSWNRSCSIGGLAFAFLTASAFAQQPAIVERPNQLPPRAEQSQQTQDDTETNDTVTTATGPFRTALVKSKPFSDVINSMYGHPDEAIRIDPQQTEVLRQLRYDFRMAYGVFLRDHGLEWWTLLHQTQGLSPGFYHNYQMGLWRGEKRRAERDGVAFDKPEPELDMGRNLKPGTPEFDAAIKRLAKLDSMQPDVDAYQESVLAQLRPVQAEHVKKELATYLANEKRLADQYAANAQKLDERGRAVAERLLKEFNINNPEIPQEVRDEFNKADFEGQVRIMMKVRVRLDRNKGKWNAPTTQADASTSDPLNAK